MADRVLAGKAAVVTGSNSGIGLGVAEALAAAGADVVINSFTDAPEDHALAERLSRDHGVTVRYIQADMSRAGDCRALVEKAGRCDILVNNAGIQHRAPLEDFPEDAFQRLLQTNVASVFNVAQACARHMIARGRGHIVNICSVQSALARPGIAPYTATKGAVANLTKGMATDWARHGLNCNGLAPGYFDTPLNAALVADPAFSDWLCRRTPAGRWGRVEELVGAAIFLSSDAASFVNGTVVYVDGGITASL